VHSHNYEAAQEMVSKLLEADYSASYTPFLYLTSEKIEDILNGKSP
jgi:hypothetical protein